MLSPVDVLLRGLDPDTLDTLRALAAHGFVPVCIEFGDSAAILRFGRRDFAEFHAAPPESDN